MRMVELTDLDGARFLINLDLVEEIEPFMKHSLIVFTNRQVEVKEDYETIKKLIKEN